MTAGGYASAMDGYHQTIKGDRRSMASKSRRAADAHICRGANRRCGIIGEHPHCGDRGNSDRHQGWCAVGSTENKGRCGMSVSGVRRIWEGDIPYRPGKRNIRYYLRLDSRGGTAERQHDPARVSV